MASADPFAAYQQAVDVVRERLRRRTAVNISSEADREAAKELVQSWFRELRPALERLGLEEELLHGVDLPLHRLLALANGVNRRASYEAALHDLRTQVAQLEIPREIAIGRADSASGPPCAETALERRIVDTLDALVPSAGTSYRQAMFDLRDGRRVSHRGTANELRSALWDVLDRLAPDEEVKAAPGFRLEKGRDKPTHKQKARFILRNRLGGTSREAAEAAVDLIESQVGSLARAVYSRSSVSAHVETTKREVMQVKLYLDTVLSELLEIHHD